MYLVQRRHKAVMIFWLSSQAANIYGFMALLKAFSGASLFILPALLYTKYCARRSPVCVWCRRRRHLNKENKSAHRKSLQWISPQSVYQQQHLFKHQRWRAQKILRTTRPDGNSSLLWMTSPAASFDTRLTRKTAGEVVNFRIFSKHSGITANFKVNILEY